MTGVQRVLEAGLLISGALAIFIFLSLVSFNPADPSWSQTGYEGSIHNAGGAVGAWVADVLLFAFGFVAYLIPFGFVGVGYLLFRKTYQLLEMDYLAVSLRMIGAMLALIGASALSSINFDDIYYFSAGGVIGDVIAVSLLPYLNFVGTTLLLLTFFFTGVTLVTGISWLQVADKLGEWVIDGVLWLIEKAKVLWNSRGSTEASDSENDETYNEKREQALEEKSASSLTSDLFGADKQEPVLSLPSINSVDDEHDEHDESGAPRFSKQAAKKKTNSSEPATPKTKEPESDGTDEGELLPPLPSIELLDRPNKKDNPITQEELDQVSRTVETVLKEFGVDVRVAHVQPGPVITRFELDLAPGVKVSKISNLAKDIARTLSAVAVRVVEVIPGKSYVGLELPNKHREIVQLSEVINSDQFTNSDSPLTMILGKDIAGKPVVVDLAKMPHLLVAGTTGSGKSVGVNVMILSLLYKSTPEDVRLIM
ncbi:DNA translocase FtsK 4TM domain-containing protein, partial [Idiomarina sp.]|uniref:DNA translocase FtsK 4TM domain-containing protein n=1 Tax=Idiomarina sp. TaxID=1874361 RepID=UPI0025856640